MWSGSNNDIHRESLWPRSTFLEASAELPFFKKSGFGNMARRFSGVIALMLFAELNQVAGTWIYRVRHTIQIFTHRRGPYDSDRISSSRSVTDNFSSLENVCDGSKREIETKLFENRPIQYAGGDARATLLCLPRSIVKRTSSSVVLLHPVRTTLDENSSSKGFPLARLDRSQLFAIQMPSLSSTGPIGIQTGSAS
jgi:hypothetical protein